MPQAMHDPIKKKKPRTSTTTPRKQQQQIPLLALTCNNGVQVIGEDSSSSSCIQEIERLRYATDSPLLPSKGPIHEGAAVMDASHAIFALQKDNTELVCWESGRTIRKALSGRAQSLSLRRKILFGAMEHDENNRRRFFVGQCSNTQQQEPSLQIQCFSYEAKGTAQQEERHLGTFVQETVSVDHHTGSNKRKGSFDHKSTASLQGLVVFQVYLQGADIVLWKHKLKSNVVSHSQSSRITLFEQQQHKQQRHVLLCELIGNNKLVLVVSRPQQTNGCHQRESATCFSISLATGRHSSLPLELPPTTQQACMVSAEILAIATQDQIQLYHCRQGRLLLCQANPFQTKKLQEWHMLGDPQGQRLAIVHSNAQTIEVASTHIKGSTKKSLADGFFKRDNIVALQQPRELQWRLGSQPSKEYDMSDNRNIQEALESIQSYMATLTTKRRKRTSASFSSIYQTALAKAMGDERQVKRKPMKNGKKNGIAEHTEKPSRRSTPKWAPHAFVNGAMDAIVSLLLLPSDKSKEASSLHADKIEAQSLVQSLLSTGKVSARLLFGMKNTDSETSDRFFAFLNALEPTPSAFFSPVHVIHSILSHCTDVNERHLVTMIHFMLCRASPHHVATHMVAHSQRVAATTQHAVKEIKFVDEFFHVQERIEKASNKPDELSVARLRLESLSNKVLQEGLKLLVQRAVDYSSCNPTLLRHAFSLCLPVEAEARIVAQLLLNMLLEVPGAGVCRWISAISEAFRIVFSAGSAPTTLQSISDQVSDVVEQSEAILSLKHVLAKAEGKSAPTRDDKSRQRYFGDRKKELPEYSIEHLIF